MLGAYSTFGNFGNYVKPEMIWRIEDANGRVIKEVKNETREVMNEKYAYTMVDLMMGVTKFGTASGQLRRLVFLLKLKLQVKRVLLKIIQMVGLWELLQI
jgi:penicillin-binding protein 1A